MDPNVGAQENNHEERQRETIMEVVKHPASPCEDETPGHHSLLQDLVSKHTHTLPSLLTVMKTQDIKIK